MLPNDCLQHPWILNHREKARQIAQLKVEDDSSKIDTTKLRNYVKNKRFRVCFLLVFQRFNFFYFLASCFWRFIHQHNCSHI